MAVRIGIVGAGGRMGRAIADAVADAGQVHTGGVDHDDAAVLPHLARDSDVLIDFSTPAALTGTLAAARAGGAALVIGTTGLSAADHAAIDAAAAGGLAVLQSANTSLGVNLLKGLVAQAAAALGEDWDIEVLEMHHRHKVDAPSGTALLLGHAAAEGRGRAPADVDRHAPPQGHAREGGTIGYAALRGGSVAGDHQVIFATEGERIELGHRAESRAIFARGAVKAAAWLAGRSAGRYTMADVLGL